MKEYDIFVPLFHNDGKPIDAKIFRRLQKTLLDEFGGVTFFPQPNEGHWKFGDVVYHDDIVIYRVLSSKPRKATRFLAAMKQQLKNEFNQEEILIVVREVDTL